MLFWLGLDGWGTGVLGVFLFIVLIVLIGSPKFMPARQSLARSSPSAAKHPVLHSILPSRLYRSIERGTRQWLQECRTCGHRQDFWEAGGIRWHAAGEPTKWSPCENCGKHTWQVIRRKMDC